MYEYISGVVAEAAPAYAVIDVGGVGYYLNISLETYSAIEHAERAKLFVHYVVREDAQVLYGFFSREERDIFRALLGVSGVGGNTARMILSAFTADEVRTIIAAGQADVLKSVKGLGIKTAQKIIVELRDKIGAVCPASEALPLRQAADGTFDEALSALTMLGFARQASEKVLRALRKEMPAATVEELVRQALKRL